MQKLEDMVPFLFTVVVWFLEHGITVNDDNGGEDSGDEQDIDDDLDR